MKHCPECGAELSKDDVYCVKCGTKVVSDGEKIDHQDDLQQQVNNLQQQLRRQKQNNSVNVFARLAFTRKHLSSINFYGKQCVDTIYRIYFDGYSMAK